MVRTQRKASVNSLIMAALLGMLAAIMIIMTAIPIANDSTAKHIAQTLEELPLPENTEYLESTYAAGKLVGSGSGVQYFGAILIKSDETLEELERYYAALSDDEHEYIVEKQTTSDITVVEHAKLSFYKDIVPDDDCFYIVYSRSAKGGAAD